jgi:hypothetical protein
MSCYFVGKYGDDGPQQPTTVEIEEALPPSLRDARDGNGTNQVEKTLELLSYVLEPRELLKAGGDDEATVKRKNKKLFSHMYGWVGHVRPKKCGSRNHAHRNRHQKQYHTQKIWALGSRAHVSSI